MRSTYWSNTKFADWVRGVMKPGAMTMDGWNEWKDESKKKHPVRYWIAEELFDWVQNVVYWPADKLNDIRYYINNRWVTRAHALTAHPRDIKPGEWRDVGNRFLPCLFNELVNFVEVEQAWHYVLWDDDTTKLYNPPWWRKGWLRWRAWRCPEAGIAYLEWASNLTGASNGLLPGHKHYNTPTPQAVAAKEILELYYWWKEEYPHRPDPHDASGWTEYCRLREANGGLFSSKGDTKELNKMRDQALKLSTQIERRYAREDEQMMIRLIKVRESLWT